MTPICRSFALFLAASGFCNSSLLAQEEEKAAPVEEESLYSSAVVDLGIVVSDLEKSAKFYTEVLGLKEVPGFSVPAERTTAFGLTDNQPATARVFVLDDTKTPNTKLKMMAFPDAPGTKADHTYIHSTLGFSYLTLFVKDMDAALARLEKAKVKTLGETPSRLGGNNFLTTFRDPDGNVIELIGPRK